MPWYYAGPDARPVGPVSAEELHARRHSGLILPDTYVIERTDETGAVGAWKHYHEIFPDSASLPPVPPPGTAAPLHPPPPPVGVSVAAAPHPLFPSAGQSPAGQAPFPHTAAPHAHYPMRRTNSWCAWGFGLGLAGFVFSFACGLGLLLAVPALAVSILGLAQVHRHPDQSGRGLAVAGSVFSVLALMIALGFLAYWLVPYVRAHEWTVTEQSSTNSE